MVQIVLNEKQFENNRFTFSYGNREALFTIVDEEFLGHNQLGKLNRMTILVRSFTFDGEETKAQFCTTVIGFGDGTVGIKSDNGKLRGKLLNKDNMSQCVIFLYEDEDTQ